MTWNDESVMYQYRVTVPGGYDIEAHRDAWSAIVGHNENDGRCEEDGKPWACPDFLAAPEWVRVLTAHGIYPSELHMGIVVSPGDTEVDLTCTGCSRRGKPYRYHGRWFPGLTPCEGDRFCETCMSAYLDDRTNPMRYDADGKSTGWREADYITPIAESRLPHELQIAARAARRGGRKKRAQ